MQVIVRVDLTVEAYVGQAYHQRIHPPDRCGCCGQPDTLKLLGFYHRYTTGDSGSTILFAVVRFLCMDCGLTTSCLPSFAQPYRLVASPTIQAFGAGKGTRRDVMSNEGLLKRYRRRFEGWCPTLRGLVGNCFGRGPPQEAATAFWGRAVAACGSLAELTIRLVREFRTTCFGTYRCHQPTRARSSHGPTMKKPEAATTTHLDLCLFRRPMQGSRNYE